MTANPLFSDDVARFLEILMAPETMPELKPTEWSAMLRFGRQTALSARLAVLAGQAGVTDRLPEKVQAHFEAALATWRDNDRMIRYETDVLAKVLRRMGVGFALLKGGAYVFADLPFAQGRLCSDIDILVARRDLAAAEAGVRKAGWVALEKDDYDDHYYRAWMHELPPLRHRDTNTIIDIHHTILPVTSRLKPDPALLLAEASRTDLAGVHVLAPCDMALHAAAHAFYDGDLDRRVRDLYDLHCLFAHFGADPKFWTRLANRARVLQLSRPLFYALRYCGALLGSAIPDSILLDLKSDAPSASALRLMDWAAPKALMPRHPDRKNRAASVAALLLFIRSHWLKMPPGLLFRHLVRKGGKRAGIGRRGGPTR